MPWERRGELLGTGRTDDAAREQERTEGAPCGRFISPKQLDRLPHGSAFRETEQKLDDRCAASSKASHLPMRALEDPKTSFEIPVRLRVPRLVAIETAIDLRHVNTSHARLHGRGSN